jgi:hypothetical protein
VPIHPQAVAVIDIMAQMGVSFTGNPSDLRALIASFPRPAGESVGEVVNRNLPGPAGEVPVRIYSPAAGLRPALLWFHGGGWAFGSLDSAPNDLSYTIGNDRCDDCRLIRVVATRSGSLRVHVTWAQTMTKLRLFVQGQIANGGLGDLTADTQINSPARC